MKNAAHQYEDKLLEFAYGELPQHEADAVDAHVRGCARCNQALGEIRGVRATMAQLPMEAAPDAGLDSLLAYAEQAAKRNAQGEARPSFFRKFLMPLASVMALATVGVVAWRANQEFDTSPAAAAAELKADEYAARERDSAEKKQLAENFEGKGDAPLPEPAATVPVAAAQPIEDRGAVAEQQRQRAPQTEALKQKTAAPDAPARRSETRSKVAREEAPIDSAPADDWSNAGKRGGVRDNYSDGMQGGGRAKDVPGAKNTPVVQSDGDLAKAPAEEPSTVVADKVGYGLGAGPIVGGLGTGDSSVTKKEAKPRPEAKEAEAPAPQVATATPATPPPPAPSSAPKPKASLSLSTLRGSSATSANDEELALEKSDAKRLDDDAKFAARTAAANRTQLLEKARVESNRGEREGEIQLLLQVLKTGATGYEKAEALKRLCDAYEAVGQYDTGDRYCDQLLVEFPDTVAAKVVTQRRNAQQRVPSTKPASKKADTQPAQAQ